jgi:hypothetical protein
LCPHIVWVYYFSLGQSEATGLGLTVVATKFSGTLTLSQTGVADFALPLVQKLAAFNKPKRKNDLPTFLELDKEKQNNKSFE